MAEYVVNPGNRLAVATPDGDHIQHPVFGPGDIITLTEARAAPLIEMGSVTEKADDPADDKADSKTAKK